MQGLRFWSPDRADRGPWPRASGPGTRGAWPRNARLRSLAATAEYNLLLAGAIPTNRSRLLAPLWARWWGHSQHHYQDAAVLTRLHGRTVRINFGHPYPVFSRRFPSYNEPLVQLVLLTAQERGAPVRVVDIGAGIGDTALLVSQRCGSRVSEWVLVEGHPKFAALLEENVRAAGLPAVVLKALVSDVEGQVPSPATTHAGSASLQGAQLLPATTLDHLLADGKLGRIDVMKLDLDGWDGRALAGAMRVLQEWKPAVLFEWSPFLLGKTGNSWRQPFDVLTGHDYQRFVWFDKFGHFNHFQLGPEMEAVELLARFCLESQTLEDWHYDVVALPGKSAISLCALADMAEAVQSRPRASRT